MVTWMQHKEHGKHPAQGGEIEALLKSGWTVCPPKVKAEAPVLQTVPAEVKTVTPQPPQDTKRRPGRPFKNK